CRTCQHAPASPTFQYPTQSRGGTANDKRGEHSCQLGAVGRFLALSPAAGAAQARTVADLFGSADCQSHGDYDYSPLVYRLGPVGLSATRRPSRGTAATAADR